MVKFLNKSFSKEKEVYVTQAEMERIEQLLTQVDPADERYEKLLKSYKTLKELNGLGENKKGIHISSDVKKELVKGTFTVASIGAIILFERNGLITTQAFKMVK